MVFIGLQVYENISVTIAARTAVGWGPYSDLHFFTTLEDCESHAWLLFLHCLMHHPSTVPSSPVDLKEELLDDDSVRLSWAVPISPNGVINGYQIIYSGHESSQVPSVC